MTKALLGVVGALLFCGVLFGGFYGYLVYLANNTVVVYTDSATGLCKKVIVPDGEEERECPCSWLQSPEAKDWYIHEIPGEPVLNEGAIWAGEYFPPPSGQ